MAPNPLFAVREGEGECPDVGSPDKGSFGVL